MAAGGVVPKWGGASSAGAGGAAGLRRRVACFSAVVSSRRPRSRMCSHQKGRKNWRYARFTERGTSTPV
jgi:hypothetical protein